MPTEKQAIAVQAEINQWQERLTDTRGELARCDAQRTRLESQSNALILASFDDAKAKKQIADIETEALKTDREFKRLSATVEQIEAKLQSLDEALAVAKDADAGDEQAKIFAQMIKLAPDVQNANERVLEINSQFVALTSKFHQIEMTRKNKTGANVNFFRFWFEAHHPHVRGVLDGDKIRQFRVPLVDLVAKYLGRFFSENKKAA